MKKKFIIILFLILGLLGKTFADIYIPDENYVPATYTYNKDDLDKVLENKTKFLYKVSCAKSEVLKSLGLDKYDITALSFMDGDYEYNFDLKNCSLYVNNSTTNSSNYEVDDLTKKEALKISDDFIKNNLKNKKFIYSKLGNPIITNVHYANPGITPEQLKQDPNDLSINEKYMSVSVTYPFLIGGKYIYGSSGIIYGINFEVSKKGITSFTSTLFKYKLEKISGELMSNKDYTFIISKGGNNPYYGTPTNIAFKKIESVYLMSPIYTSVSNSNYLSSGIGLFSDKNSLNRFYEIISDYKQGNAYGFLY